jgi:hypothetical protein
MNNTFTDLYTKWRLNISFPSTSLKGSFFSSAVALSKTYIAFGAPADSKFPSITATIDILVVLMNRFL